MDEPPDLLFKSISEGNESLAFKLVRGPGATKLLQYRATPSLCTPLMLAARQGLEQLVEEMLGHGCDFVGITLRSKAGWTAADYAAEHGRNASIVERLRTLEQLELEKTAQSSAQTSEAPCNCKVCGQALKRRPRLLTLADRYFKDQESNALVGRFFRSHYNAFLQLLQPELHVLGDKRNMNKELSESLAVVEAFERSTSQPGCWHVIDLCCGKSLTAALLALRHPTLTITTVDRIPVTEQPHYVQAGIATISYHQLDVLEPDFVDKVASISAIAKRPTALLGMHLCGRLSECAVNAFHAVENVHLCVLSPCCLPNLDDAPACLKHVYGAKNLTSEDRFSAWESYLEALVRSNDVASVERFDVPDILSPRRTLITASKREKAEKITT